MTSRGERPDVRDAALASASATGIAACALGISDVALRGADLDPGSAATTVLLWVALAALPALIAGAAAALAALAIARRAPATAAALSLAIGLTAAAIVAAATRALSLGEAIALAAAALACVGWLTRRSAWVLRAPPIAACAIVAAPLAAAALAFARGPIDLSLPERALAARDARPNVVVIVLDTLRADHLGAYGDARGLSPAFDRLAAQGTLFERCYAPGMWTVPSHASLFTGAYPIAHGASFEQHRWLDDRFTTLAEALRDSGYRTAGFASNSHVALANLAQGFELYREIGAPFERLALRNVLQVLGGPARFIDHGAEQGALEIERFLRDRDSDEAPLFLFLNLLEPHWRHLPPTRQRAHFLPDETGYLAATRFSMRFYGPLWMARTQPHDPLELATLRGLYAAEVAYQDAQLARFVASIDRHLGDDTLLVITADHGENLGEAGRFDHVFALNDHLVHVPMLLRHAGKISAGARDDGPCQLVDVPATIADAVGGLALDPAQRGQSLLPERARPRRHAFIESDPFYGHMERITRSAGFVADVARFTAKRIAVHDGRFKYVESSRGEPELFDVASDPDETRDVGDEHPELRDALARELAEWRRSQQAYSIEAQLQQAGANGADADAATFDRLRELGYVE